MSASRKTRKSQKLPGTDSPPIPQAVVDRLHDAAAAFQRGDIDGAERLYGAVGTQAPDNPDVLHGLGAVALRRDEPGKAADFIERAVRHGKVPGQFFTNLAVAYQKLGREDDAVKALKRGTSQDRKDPNLHRSLAVILTDQGKDSEAIRSLENAARLDPDAMAIQKMLGDLQFRHGRFNDAAEHYRRYLQTDPRNESVLSRVAVALGSENRHQDVIDLLLPLHRDGFKNADLCNNIGTALVRLDRMDDAEPFIMEAVELDPTRWQFVANVGGLHLINDRVDAALAVFERLHEQRPDDHEVTTDLALIHSRVGHVERSVELLTSVLEKDEECGPAWAALGTTFTRVNRHVDAIKALRRAIEIDPTHLAANDNIAMSLKMLNDLDEANFYAHKTIHLPEYKDINFANSLQIFHASCDFDGLAQLGDPISIAETVPPMTVPGAIFELMVHADRPEDIHRIMGVHRRWGEAVEAQAAEHPLPPFPKKRKPGKIRIGLLSSDLRDHAVGKHLMPLLTNYDRDRFELYGYSPWPMLDDPIQKEIAGLMSGYRALHNKRAREVAEAIREDEIDILFELNGFTLGSGMEAVVYRPAPIQIEWLGYPFSTGLQDMDYFLLDKEIAPADPSFMTEKPLLMPESWTTFGDYPEAEITEQLPFEQTGIITFGTLNNPYKFTAKTIAAWAAVMAQVPDSRFVVVRPETISMVLCTNIINEFAKHGIGSDRVAFVDNRTQDISHFECYNGIDVSLDTFPITGGTTTCDAMWMGVPVVTLEGPAYHQRISAGLLRRIGLDELCTSSEAEFVERSVALANDTDSLKFLRTHLRAAIRDSILCDGETYAQQWCDTMEAVAKKHGLI